MQTVRNHAETETICASACSRAEEREGKDPRQATRPQELLYSEHVRYVEQLRPLSSGVPGRAVLVLIYEDFRRDTRRP